MSKFFKWIYKPEGHCPVQSEGYFLGYFFYFRARGQYATIEFYNKKEDFDYMPPIWQANVKKVKSSVAAGWFPKWLCKLLVFKGCFLFWLKLRFSNEF